MNPSPVFQNLRYAQCWEDADVLLDGLQIRPDDICVSIASGGDNTLALLTANPERIITLDCSPAQIACLSLKMAAFRCLDHSAMLELLGSRPSDRRHELYSQCLPALSPSVRTFWDARMDQVRKGIGSAGRFERYFQLFRQCLLPFIHSRRRVDALFLHRDMEARTHFYHECWDTWRWRLFFRIFFSRTLMARLGRDPSFYRFADDGDSAAYHLQRACDAAVRLDPADNPFMQWILLGEHRSALPFALRPENFEIIRARLDRIEIHSCSLQEWLQTGPAASVHRWNLSNIFEYMSGEDAADLLAKITRHSHSGARLLYWNMLVPRHRPETMKDSLHRHAEEAARLHARDKAFFYSGLQIEEVLG